MVGTVFEHPIDDGVGGVEHDELGFGLGAAALGRNRHFDRVAANQLDRDDGRSVVFGVGPLAGRIGQDGGAQLVVGVEIGAAHALVDQILQLLGLLAGGRLKAHVHADLEKDGDDACVLTDGTMSLGAHAAVDQQLGDGVLGRGRLLALVGLGQTGDEVFRVVVADVLQRTGDAGNKIFLSNDGHDGSSCTL